MLRVTEETHMGNEVILINPNTITEVRPITEDSYQDYVLRQTKEDFRNDDGDYITSTKSVIFRTGELEDVYVLETADEIHQQLIQLHQ